MEHHRSLLKTDLGVIYEGTLFHPLQQFSFFFFFPICEHEVMVVGGMLAFCARRLG